MNIIYPENLNLYIDGVEGKEIIGLAEQYLEEDTSRECIYKTEMYIKPNNIGKCNFMNKKILDQIDTEYALNSTKKRCLE